MRSTGVYCSNDWFLELYLVMMYGEWNSCLNDVVLMTLMSSLDSLPHLVNAKNSLNAVVIICTVPILEQ